MLNTLFPRCAGIDVHKRMVMVCRILASTDGTLETTIRSFGTTTAELLRLSDWLTAGEVTHVAMESTGVYWKPIFNLLEGNFTVWVWNAQHVKNVPGRKTDVKDAQWLAELLRHGLVQPSFIPPADQRALRELTRERTNFVRQRATLVNRVQKVLEGANIKLGDVATNVLGVSGRAMLDAIVAGETAPRGRATAAGAGAGAGAGQSHAGLAEQSTTASAGGGPTGAADHIAGTRPHDHHGIGIRAELCPHGAAEGCGATRCVVGAGIGVWD
ncbi:MAG: IS110 family transposase [Actinomycetota bacterium]|nr:IS110 family transposase [Actinomycetota bacterium]